MSFTQKHICSCGVYTIHPEMFVSLLYYMLVAKPDFGVRIEGNGGMGEGAASPLSQNTPGPRLRYPA